MGLSIKDADTERLVRELAKRRGTGVTGAVKLAVTNELAREDDARNRNFDEVWAEIQKIQKRYAARGPAMTAEEIDAWMYDENGLPH